MSVSESCNLNIGAWVKTPGLDPQESNALNYLDRDQLIKLASRVARALQTIDSKAAKLERMTPGTEVSLVRLFQTMAAGSDGIVVEREQVVGAEFQPDDYIPVAFVGRGIAWVPVAYLFNESHCKVGYGQ